MPMLTLTPPRCHCLCQNLHTLQGPAAWGRVNETSSALPFPVINNQLGLQHGLLDASSSNTVKFPEAALAGRAWSHVQRCPWGVWGPSPLERVPLLLCPFLYVCVFAPTLLESKPHQSQERAIILSPGPHPDPGLQQVFGNGNENGRDEQSNTLTNISLNCVWKIP